MLTPKRRRVAIALTVGIILAIVVGVPVVDRWLLMRDARLTLDWLAAGAVPAQRPHLLVSGVGPLSAANRAAATEALARDWLVHTVVEYPLHDAVWVVVQISPDLSSASGQVTSLRYTQVGWFRYELLPDSSEILTFPPSSDNQ